MRRYQEDAYVLGKHAQAAGLMDLATTEANLSNNGATVAVIDGMGGMGGGDIASTWLARRWLGARPRTVATLNSSLQLDNETLLSTAAKTTTPQMGAAATGLVLQPNHVLLHHVGDTRAYHVTKTKTTQLTTDHVCHNGGLTQCFGGGYEQAHFQTLEPQVTKLPYWTEGILLLVSDGVWPDLSPELLTQILKARPDPKDLVMTLAGLVLEGPASDNLTLLALSAHG